MATTRVFKNGNSQAVRIPAEFAFDRTDVELEIERVGDELRIRQARRRLGDVLSILAAFPASFAAEGRLAEPDQDREGL